VNRLVGVAPLVVSVVLGLAAGSSDVYLPPLETVVVSASETAFADQLVAALGGERSGNLVVSPANVYDALAMLLPGARGASESRLRSAMHATQPPEELLASSIARQDRLNGGGVDLAAARGAWLEQTFPVRPSYAGILARAGAPPQLTDFINAPDVAREVVNAWANERTRGRIPNLLPPKSVDQATRLVLATALALDARWATPFDKANTSSAPFHGAGGTRQAPTMHETASFGYASAPGYQAVELPYENSRLSALIVLPDAGVDPLALLPNLSTISSAMQPKRVALALPRVELSTALNLQPALHSLGLGQLFTRNADLSGIGGRPGDLLVGSARQQAWLAIGEEGTHAAAATAIIVIPTSSRVDLSAIRINVDRPFLFVVRDHDNGIPLFVARISDIA
jgi:serpin B